MLTSIFIKMVQIFHFQESKNAGITDKRITFLGNSWHDWHPFFQASNQVPFGLRRHAALQLGLPGPSRLRQPCADVAPAA